jgi:hypothetical protein
MNERIKLLAGQAWRYADDNSRDGDGTHGWLYRDKFAELIVKECIYTLQKKVLRNGSTPENIRSYQHIQDLGDKFGITFPIDYNPDRNN